MDSSQLINSLVNSGALGILAAVLFYLHVSSLKVFREELKSERENTHRDHEKIMEALRNYTKAVFSVIRRLEERERRQ